MVARRIKKYAGQLGIRSVKEAAKGKRLNSKLSKGIRKSTSR